jgi:thioredoxin-like negative regulator of GroEL
MQNCKLGTNTLGDLKKTLKNTPNNLEANFKLARKYIERQNYHGAREHLNRIIKLDSNNTNDLTDDAKFQLATISKNDSKIENIESFMVEYPQSNQN